MKKLLKILGVVAVCATFAVVAYNQVNAKPENPILAKNIEALSQSEGGGNISYYKVTKYAISRLFKVVKVNGNASVSLGALLTAAQVEAQISGSIECEPVDCHKRVCCNTTIRPPYDCPYNDTDWQMCHSQCNHSENQL